MTTDHNLFNIARTISKPPKMLDYWPFRAPKHRADLPDEREMLGDPLSRASAWYTMTGPLHCGCKRCRVGWPHLSGLVSS